MALALCPLKPRNMENGYLPPGTKSVFKQKVQKVNLIIVKDIC